MPYEYFIAPGVTIALSEKWSSQTNIIYDPKTQFTFGKTRLSWDFSQYSALDLFASSPLSIKREESTLGQRLLTTDVGFALRFMF